MKSKYHTVWTPERISDFVTKVAVDNNGGRYIRTFKQMADASNYAYKLNNETKLSSGYYCIIIDEA